MTDTHIRNFKDFLLLYNQISETCFQRCANTFMSREMTTEEEQCIKNCAEKHIHANHKIMEIYMEVQPILVKKRIEEMNSTQAALEAQAQQQAEAQAEALAEPQVQVMDQVPEEMQIPEKIEQAVQ